MRRMFLPLVLVIACTSSRTAMVERPDQEQFAAGRAALDAGRLDEAADQFAAFLKQFPRSELADEAMYRRGQALSRADKLQEAQAQLQELLEQRPTSRFKEPAALELQLVQAKLSKNQEAAQALQKSVDEQREREKAQGMPRSVSLRAAAQAFTGGGPAAP